MDAWNTLISNSTLTPAPGIDAWMHLNAQGGGGEKTYISPDVLEFNVDPLEISFDVEITELPFVMQRQEVEFNMEPAQIEFVNTVVTAEDFEFNAEKRTIEIISKNADIKFIAEEV